MPKKSVDEEVEKYGRVMTIEYKDEQEYIKTVQVIDGDHIGYHINAFRGHLLAQGFHPDNVNEFVPYVDPVGY